MTRFILLLLINIIGSFAANAIGCNEHVIIISQYGHDNEGKIESTQISTVPFGIIEGNNVFTNYFAAGNKLRHFGYYSSDRLLKTGIVSNNINLLTIIRKDIHFLSVLLI